MKGNQKSIFKKYSKEVTTGIFLALVAAAPAFAVGSTPGTGTVNTIISWMQGLGIGVVTVAVMWTGFRVLFAGARIQDCAPILIGGILIGGAAGIASMVVG